MHLQLLQKLVYDHRLMRPAAWQLRLVLMSYAYSEIEILVQGMAGNLREPETQITIGAEKFIIFCHTVLLA